MKNKKYNKKGFTLLEILLVIALIGILASIVLVAINPARQLAEARNKARFDDITKINQALEDYFVANRSYPAGLNQGNLDICPPSGGSSCVDLSALVPNYLPSIPIAPNAAAGKTGYTVSINPQNKQLALQAGNSELGATIAINPWVPTMIFAQKGTAANAIGNNYSSATLADGSSIVLSGNGFITKYSTTGSIVWSKQVTTVSGTVTGVNISTFTDGSSMVLGMCSDTVTFGPSEVNQQVLTCNSGIRDIFIAKYNTDGTFAWVRKTTVSAGLTYIPNLGVTSLSDGSSIITGLFWGTSNFGGTILTSRGNMDMFITKYDTSGNVVWAKQGGQSGWTNGSSIASWADGSSIVTGKIDGTARFGNVGQEVTLSDTLNGSMFMAKYNADGSLAWVKKTVESWLDEGYSVDTFTDGSSIVTGRFNGSSVFGSGESFQTTLNDPASGPNNNIFIAKYNSNGTLAWAKRVADTSWEDYSLWGIKGLSSDGSSIVAGSFSGTEIFGSPGNQITLTSSGGADIAILKYSSTGTLVWAKQAGGLNDDYGSDIGGIYTNGNFTVSGAIGASNASFANDEYILNGDTNGSPFTAKYVGN